jgi:hypothetical protein
VAATGGYCRTVPHHSGHGLWADGRLGAAEKSNILLNDYVLIEELSNKEHRELFYLLNDLGDRAVLEFEPTLRTAIKKYSHVYVLTHTSPFAESAWHNHHISDPQFLSHFTCHAVGEMIRSVMSQYPDKMPSLVRRLGLGRKFLLHHRFKLTPRKHENEASF